MTLDSKIEAILFFRGEPVAVKKLAWLLETTEEKIREALAMLDSKLAGRGLQLVFKEDEVMLGTSKDASDIVAKITKEELSRDIGKAGLETLSTILYRGPISRREIDYIRGVNSNFTLRNLVIRGLVERVTNPDDERVFLYKPTFDLLSFLGIKEIQELPEYESVRKELAEAEKETPRDKEEV